MTASATTDAIPITNENLRFGDALESWEREELATLVTEPYEYMPDNCFEEPGIEAELFNPARDIPRRPATWYRKLDRPAEERVRDATLKPVVFTKEQEQTAFLRYNYCRFRAEAVRLSMAMPSVATTKGRAMIHWHRRALEQRELIAEYNVALVLAMSRRLPDTVHNVDEMIADGNLALVRAIDKFRVDRGFKFSTYACRCILKAFSRLGEIDGKRKSRIPFSYDPSMERSQYDEQRHAEHESDCVEALSSIIKRNSAGLTETEAFIVTKRFNLDDPD